jgi:amidophosphoribosyltransferase
MARDAGARKVYLASAAPPVKYPNVYGIDMPSRVELIAYERNEDQISKEIGADGLIYQNLEDLKLNITQENPLLKDFDCSCFDGKYVTGDIDDVYLNNIELKRSENSINEPLTNSSTQLDLNLINPSVEEEHA